jgi:hypothetical protein
VAAALETAEPGEADVDDVLPDELPEEVEAEGEGALEAGGESMAAEEAAEAEAEGSAPASRPGSQGVPAKPLGGNSKSRAHSRGKGASNLT